MNAILDSKTAYEMMHREQIDYHQGDIFQDYCEDDPTIQNRYNLARQAHKVEMDPDEVLKEAQAPAPHPLRQATFDDYFWNLHAAFAPTVTPAPKKSAPVAQPAKPKQALKQVLKTTTALTPSAFATNTVHHRRHPSLRTTKKAHCHIDWRYYENILKLFAFIQLYQGDLTPQQQLDKDTLTQAVERVGNAQFKKKRLTAPELMVREARLARGARPYLAHGRAVVMALVNEEKGKTEKDPKKAAKYTRDSAALLRVLAENVAESGNAWDQAQRQNITEMAHNVFRAVRDAYKQK